ncbi:MAG: TatD family nuclease-associated radical SAM protein [Clostridia bacterium]|nr:TatD family nuclease-associated radical SAM protein [Clostridia bacterium]
MSATVYDFGGGLYLNITNKCPCACHFCIRNFTDGLGDADSLFLDHEPSVKEVLEELEKWPVTKYDELVFCGYGEPTERLDALIEIAKFVRAKYMGKDSRLKTIRLNTNGLADLINGKPTAHMLEGVIDSISISMNEADAEKYYELCEPVFGLKSYDAIFDYIRDVKQYVPHVASSVVGVISSQSIEICRKKAQELGIDFRVR